MRSAALAPTFADGLERAQRDGCGCPGWVVRCAHFGGRIVALANRLETKHTCNRIWGERYSVGTDSGWLPCDGEGCPDVMGREFRGDYDLMDDLDAAQAEFDRREQGLIGA